MGQLRFLLCTVLGLFLSHARGFAQCMPDWAPGLPLTGVNGPVYVMLALPNGDLFLGGSFTGAGTSSGPRIAHYSLEKQHWVPLRGSIPFTVRSAAVLTDGRIAVGGGDWQDAELLRNGGLAIYDPVTRDINVITTSFNGPVLALAALPQGDLLLGGQFTRLATTSYSRCLRYSPATNQWRASGGFNLDAEYFEKLPSGDIIVSGQFNDFLPDGQPGGAFEPSTRFLRWIASEERWVRVLGSGVTSGPSSSPIVADTTSNSFFFSQSPSQLVKHNIDTGETLVYNMPGLTQSGTRFALSTDGGTVVTSAVRFTLSTSTATSLTPSAGSSRQQIVSLPNGGFATFKESTSTFAVLSSSDSTWRFTAERPRVIITTMCALPDGRAVVAGDFSVIDDVPAANIAFYDPLIARFTPITSGTNGPIDRILTLSSGAVLLCGQFTQAGGIPAGGAALLDANTQTFTPLPSWVTGSTKALLELPSGNVLVGGSFTLAAPVPSTNIARYSVATQSWLPCGAGANGPVTALVRRPDGVAVAGGFFSSMNNAAAAGNLAWFVEVNSNPQWTSFANTVGVSNVSHMLAVINNDRLLGATDTQEDYNRLRSYSSAGGWATERTGFSNDFVPKSLLRLASGDILIGGISDSYDFSPCFITSFPSYQRLGGRVERSPSNMCELANGEVLIAGDFRYAGSVVANGFAQFVRAPAPLSEPTLQPSASVLCEGATASFTVTISGGAPIRYRWLRDGVPISPATNPSARSPVLSIPHVSAADSGEYSCEIENSCNTRITFGAILTVTAPNSIDFNQNALFPEDQDLIDFLSVLAGGSCSNDPNCDDIDFNNDGLFPSDDDLISFLRVLAGGQC